MKYESEVQTPKAGFDDDALADMQREVLADARAMRDEAEAVARTEVAEAICAALSSYGKSLAELERSGGPDKSTVSKLANGKAGAKGCTVGTLARIALAMGKDLKIEIV
ncbi:MAG: hypothetical protein ACFE0P_10650 [Oceanicaulis sp.]